MGMTRPSPKRGKPFHTHVASTNVRTTWQQRARSYVAARLCAIRFPNRTRLTHRHRAEGARVAAIEALFASVNPQVSQGKELQEALSKAIDAVAAMPNKTSGVQRVLYPSLAKMLGKIEPGAVPRFDVGGLRTLLFGDDVGVEAIRLLRAEAVAAAAKQPWVAEEMKSDLEAGKV